MSQSPPNPLASKSGRLEEKANRWASLERDTEDRFASDATEAGRAFRVAIVDRDSMGSDLLASAIDRQPGYHASSIRAADLLRAISRSEVHIAVIGAELHSELGSGFDLARRIGAAYPETYIIMLIHDATHESVVNAFLSGARGVFSRQQTIEEFLDCVAYVGRGQLWAGKQEAMALLEAFKSIPAPGRVPMQNSILTAREMQVVQCAAKGRTNKAIASELQLSEHTVKNYLFRAFEKLGVCSRVELLFYLAFRGYTLSAAGFEGPEADFSCESPRRGLGESANQLKKPTVRARPSRATLAAPSKRISLR